MGPESPRLCRVALHTDTVRVDLTLPAFVPIASLIPSVVDLVAEHNGRSEDRAGAPYRLSRPGTPALDASKTLAQHGIRDGATLLLTRGFDAPPEPLFTDVAERVSATVRAHTRAWTPRTAQRTACLAAVLLAAVAGFTAVPGGPGAPNALLAAAAAATVALVAVQLKGCAGPALTAVGGVAVVATGSALAVVVTGCSTRVIAAATAVAAIALLQIAARLAMLLTGLSGDPGGTDEAAGSAHDLLTGLIVASSVAAALSAVALTGEPRGVALATVIAAALLFRARSHTDLARCTSLLFGGIIALGAALAAVAMMLTARWPCGVAAALAGVSLYLGFSTPLPSPVIRRGAELLEYLTLAAVVPVACWVCGCYEAVSGLSLG